MNKIINIILSTIGFFVGMIIIFMILLKLTNHSPTIEQIILTITSLIAVMVYRMKFQLGKFTEFMENTKDSITNLKDEIKEIKQEFKQLNNKIDNKFEKLEDKFNNIDKQLMLIEQRI